MPADPDAPAPSLRRAKQTLRGRILAMRDDLPAQVRDEASQTIAARLVALPSFKAARSVLMTLPFGSEWDTRLVVEQALGAGKAIVVPRVDRVARMLVLHDVGDVDRDIVPGYLAIPEPRPDRPAVDPASIEWALVPGVAFDLAGRRLGYGGGFYDRLLPLLRDAVPRVVGAFDLQIVDEVPAGPHDRRVDRIVTESRQVEIAPSR